MARKEISVSLFKRYELLIGQLKKGPQSLLRLRTLIRENYPHLPHLAMEKTVRKDLVALKDQFECPIVMHECPVEFEITQQNFNIADKVWLQLPVPEKKELTRKEVLSRIDDLNLWIRANTNDPKWMQVVSERNALTVKLEVLRQQETGQWNVALPEAIIPFQLAV